MPILSETAAPLFTIFVIAALGYLVGSISFHGVKLGSSAIFLVGLLFGHLGVALPYDVQTLGLALFISAVGLSAGPTFAEKLRQSGRSYLILCSVTALTGALLCVVISRVADIETPVMVGMMTGAYTTSPGFAAAKEAAEGAGAVAMVAAGYGIVYPFGVLGKVLFIQLAPRILKADMAYERQLIAGGDSAKDQQREKGFRPDKLGAFTICISILSGVLLGSVNIPLPVLGNFSLGTTGGVLLVTLLLGHLGHLGPISFCVDKTIINPIKELGLILFFVGSSLEGGSGFAEVFAAYGPKLILWGIALTLIPMLTGFLFSQRVLKLPLLNGLASMTASMTSTPSLAALIQTSGTDDVVIAYAATYPIALITLVILVPLLMAL